MSVAIEEAISQPRLSTYRSIASNDNHAWALYRWNVDLVAGLMPMFSDLEVALRNSVHDQLRGHFNQDDWWNSSSIVLDKTATEMISRASKPNYSAGKVVSRTTLGLWVHMLTRGGKFANKSVEFDRRLWRPALKHGFQTTTGNSPTRLDVYKRASIFHQLRNRVAHHEPIFAGVARKGTRQKVPLKVAWDESVELLDWICPELALLHINCDVVALMSNRPTP